MFRGFIELIKPNTTATLGIEGRDYMVILMERFAVNKQYGAFNIGSPTPRTRQYIMQDLITTYLTSDFGPVYFTETYIQALTTATFDKQYDFVSLAEIFYTFAKEEGAQVYIELQVELPLQIIYEIRLCIRDS